MRKAGAVEDHSQTAVLERYFSLMHKYPEWFENHDGGIELLTGIDEIRAAQDAAREARAARGLHIAALRPTFPFLVILTRKSLLLRLPFRRLDLPELRRRSPRTR